MNLIVNPITERKVSIFGKTGRKVLENYITYLQRGGIKITEIHCLNKKYKFCEFKEISDMESGEPKYKCLNCKNTYTLKSKGIFLIQQEKLITEKKEVEKGRNIRLKFFENVKLQEFEIVRKFNPKLLETINTSRKVSDKSIKLFDDFFNLSENTIQNILSKNTAATMYNAMKYKDFLTDPQRYLLSQYNDLIGISYGIEIWKQEKEVFKKLSKLIPKLNNSGESKIADINDECKLLFFLYNEDLIEITEAD